MKQPKADPTPIHPATRPAATLVPLPGQVAMEPLPATWPTEYPLLESLPAYDDLKTLESVVPSGGHVTVVELDALLRSGRVLDPADPMIRAWHYAELCRGTFRAGEETFTFVIYRGGLARVGSEDGRSAYVAFPPPPQITAPPVEPEAAGPGTRPATSRPAGR